MITLYQKGSFNKTLQFLSKAKASVDTTLLNEYGHKGVTILSQATPKDSGETSNSWTYTIEKTNNSVSLCFNNSNIQNDVPIAIILQYGHATRSGSWVQGIDYINPAARPLFDELAKAVWKEVVNS